MKPDHYYVRPNRFFKNSLGVGLLLVLLDPTHCENGSHRNTLIKETLASCKESSKNFVDNDGRIWHIYSNDERGQDTTTDDANQYGLFY